MEDEHLCADVQMRQASNRFVADVSYLPLHDVGMFCCLLILQVSHMELTRPMFKTRSTGGQARWDCYQRKRALLPCWWWSGITFLAPWPAHSTRARRRTDLSSSGEITRDLSATTAWYVLFFCTGEGQAGALLVDRRAW